MRSEDFWHNFNTLAKPKLDARADTFEQIFSYLDRFDRPVGILETGCVRQPGNWNGDGGSTFLFDDYAKGHPGSVVYTVDIDPKATKACRVHISPCVKIHTGDSVAYLQSLADNPPEDLPHLDLLYLDSYDLDPNNPTPSAVHHLKELVAIAPLLRAETLVVVDDSPQIMAGFHQQGKFRLMMDPRQKNPRVGGKGMYVAEYAEQVGAKSLFAGYQCGWTNLRINKT